MKRNAMNGNERAGAEFDYKREMWHARIRCGVLAVFCAPLSVYVSSKLAKMKRHWKLGDVDTAVECARQIRRCGFLRALLVDVALLGVMFALAALLIALS